MNSAALASTARRYADRERRLFEVLGAWVPSVAEPEVKLALRVQSFRHAWHAELWAGLRPQARGLEDGADRETGTDVPNDDVLAVMGEPHGTVERLAGVYRVVLPTFVAEYRSLREEAAPASDGPLLRALWLVLADEEAALDEGLRLLAGRTAPRHEARLRGLLPANVGTESRQSTRESTERHPG